MRYKSKVATRFLAFLCLCLSLNNGCSNGLKTANVGTRAPERAVPPPGLEKAMQRIEPFFRRMGPPAPFDWLVSHKESGQTFEEYLNENPTLPTPQRQIIYILPLGKFDDRQEKIIRVTAGWLQAFYGLPTHLMARQRIPDAMPLQNYRKPPSSRARQLRIGYILEELLAPRLPPDAAAMIALTNEDLYPDESMNFVFGQASFDKRVGVWSLYRLGEGSDTQKFLTRTLKIATHETGHMFSIRHCTKYECVMSGSNYLGETDRHPLDACPECMAKISWLSKVDPAGRYQQLADYCAQNSLRAEAAEFQKKLAAVR